MQHQQEERHEEVPVAPIFEEQLELPVPPKPQYQYDEQQQQQQQQIDSNNYKITAMMKPEELEDYDPTGSKKWPQITIALMGHTGGGKTTLKKSICKKLGIKNYRAKSSSIGSSITNSTVYTKSIVMNMIDTEGWKDQKHFDSQLEERIRSVQTGSFCINFDVKNIGSNSILNTNVHTVLMLINPIQQDYHLKLPNTLAFAKALSDSFNEYVVVYVITHAQTTPMLSHKQAIIDEIKRHDEMK